MALARPGLAAPRHTAIALNAHHPWQTVHADYTVLVTNPDGSFSGVGREGLWDYETRILSRWRATLNGIEPILDAAGALECDRWHAHLRVPRTGGTPAGPVLPQDTFEVAILRRVGPGMEERIRVINHSMAPAETELVLELDADFLDIVEVGTEREQRGAVDVGWDDAQRCLTFDDHAEHAGRTLHRAVRIRVVTADTEPERDGRRLRFRLNLPPRGVWSATLHYEPFVDGRWRAPLEEAPPDAPLPGTTRDRERARWRSERPRLECAHRVVGPAFDQAADDLFCLRNRDLETEPGHWVVNAGLPAYVALFGRDILTASWQGAMVGAEFARGALEIVARTQATEDSVWRDAEPGKLIHEAHRGPLADLRIRPTDAYYGTQTTPSMFVLLLSEAWHWTGDDALLRRHRDTALRALEWAARYGDRDGDGFLEYERRSPRGLRNQGWKDSDEGIRHADGSLAETPIATVEEQAFYFIALQRMAEILTALGEETLAEDHLARAATLRERFEQAFWMPDERFYALALDGEKRQVRSITSNPGHALGAGIVRADRARAVADRLLAPDMFSGWGVRTLSTRHPSYNPFSYHLGSVWTVENATFALGMKRYGLDEHAERVIAGQFAAAAYFQGYRLPEALGGHSRDDAPFPTIYPNANSPQAWSAGATIQFVQVILGLYPFAPARTLAVIRPRLPEWLPVVTVHRLRVGNATVSIRFERQQDGTTAWDVIERDGLLFVIGSAPPQDLRPADESTDEMLKAWLLEHAPGRTARALRVALGIEEAA